MAGGRSTNGCHLSLQMGFVFVFLAVLLAVGVGIITYFASRGSKVICSCEYPGLVPVASDGRLNDQFQQCALLATAHNKCIGRSPCSWYSNPTVVSSGGKTTAKSPEVLPTNLPSAPATSGAGKELLLPTTLIPTHYNIEIKPDIYSDDPKEFKFDGNEEIYFVCKQKTKEIVIHSLKLNISNVEVHHTSPLSLTMAVASVRYDVPKEFFIITLTGELTAGESYVVSLDFSGPLVTDMYGLYMSSYKQGNKTRYLATSLSQPTYARKAFPCFDEPALKATFNVTLLRRANMTSLSNMPLWYTEDRADGWLADHFEKSVKMSTYLLGFLVSEFAYKENATKSGTKVRVWVRPDIVKDTEFAVDLGTRVLEKFEEYFGIKYPLTKLDMVGAPDLASGAMENWGLMPFREQYLVYDKAVTATRDVEILAQLIIHEVSHQWFGNLVTFAWWDEIWLNEGFASYMEIVGLELVLPDWNPSDLFLVNSMQTVLNADSYTSSHPLYRQAYDPKEIRGLFDSIAYNKGAAVLRMLRYILGVNTFKRGLKRYLERHKYGNTNHSDLWGALAQQASEDGRGEMDIDEIMDGWIKQTGYPLLTVTHSGGRVTLEQRRFLLGDASTNDGSLWNVPVTIATSRTPTWNGTLHWMKNRRHELKVDPTSSWVLINIDVQGYFRVNYDENNWQALAKQLLDDHMVIDKKNRAQLINDAFVLASDGRLQLKTALSLLGYMQKESDYPAWGALAEELGRLKAYLGRTSVYGKFEKFVRNLFIPAYNKTQLVIRDSDSLDLRFLRLRAVDWACSTGYGPCVDEAVRQYRAWMDGTFKVHPDLLAYVYCTAIRAGGHEEWDHLYDYFRFKPKPTELFKILYALGCSREPWILTRYLERSLNTSIFRPGDSFVIPFYISWNPHGSILAWNFMRRHWSTYKANLAANWATPMSSVLENLATRLNSPSELQEMEDFINSQPEDEKNLPLFKKAKEKVQGNIMWMKKNYQTVNIWLHSLDL